MYTKRRFPRPEPKMASPTAAARTSDSTCAGAISDSFSTSLRLCGNNCPVQYFAGRPQDHSGCDLRAPNVQSDRSELLLTVHLRVACDREGDDGLAVPLAEDRRGENVIGPRWLASLSQLYCWLRSPRASECHARRCGGAGVFLVVHSPSPPGHQSIARSDRGAQTLPSIPRCFARSRNLSGPNHPPAGLRSLRYRRTRERDVGSVVCNGRKPTMTQHHLDVLIGHGKRLSPWSQSSDRQSPGQPPQAFQRSALRLQARGLQ